MSELTNQILNLKPGDHLCLFYEKNPAEQMPALVPFIQEALTRNEQFIYIADDQTVEQLRARLQSGGINVAEEIRNARLNLWTRDEWRQPGALSSERKAFQVKQFISKAAATGFKGIRFAVEMTWTLGPDINAHELEHWEATINTIFTPEYPGRIICQYNQSRLAPEALIAGLHTHPLAILGDEVCPNPFYQAPLVLNGHTNGNCNGHSDTAARARANWMIGQIKQARIAQRQREELVRKETALREQRKRAKELSVLLETAAMGLHWVAEDGKIIWANKAEMDMLGYSPEEYIGHHISEFHADDQIIENILCRLKNGEQLHQYEARLRCKDGTIKTVLIDSSVLWDNGRFVHTQCFTRDVTEQKRVEKALQLSEERFRLAAFSDAITLYEQDRDLRYTWLYPLHPEHEHALGRTDLELLPNQYGEALSQWKREVMASGQPQRREVDTGDTMGHRTYDVFIVPKRNAAGEIVGIGGTALDITRRKEAERALRDAEERFRSILANSPTVIFIKDMEGRYLQVNRWYEELFHRSEKEIVGKTDFDIFPAEIAQRFRENDLTVARTGKPLEVEEIAPHDDGLHTYISIKFPLRRQDGTIYAIAGMSTDITDRKVAEMAARRLAAIVETSDDAIVSKDLNGIISSWNQGAERIFGYTTQEIIGRPITTIIPTDRHSEEADILARLRRGERIAHFETIRQRKDGSLVEISLTISPIKDASGKIVGASKIARDISERRQTDRQEQALYDLVTSINRASTNREIYDAALDAISHCHNADRASILLKEKDGVMRFKAWRHLSDEYRAAVEGHSPWKPDETDPQPICISDVREVKLEEHLRTVIEHEGIRALAFIPICHESRLLGKFMIYYNAPHQFTPQQIRLAQTISIQIGFALERQQSGEALERLVNERTASLREAIAQMEEFSYTVSHDLRAPVRAMHGYAKVLLEDHSGSLNSQAREYLERIVRGGTRMDHLIQDVLTYSRLSRREFTVQPMDLDKLVRELLQQYRENQSARGEVVITGTLHSVIAHEASLTQAISNLINNAFKFVSPGTIPRIRIRTHRINGDVRLSIEDNGIGIRPEHQHRLFGMFERVHPERSYEGTGIGLAIVRKAVERMGGKVGVESDGLTGSNFWIQLPASK